MTNRRIEPPTNRDLMRRVQADDTDAFSVLYDRLAPSALRVAGVVCADVDRARDAVQEAFLSMWRGRASYRSESGAVESWIFGIVRNRAIDGLRRERRHVSVSALGDGIADEVSAPGDVEAQAVVDDDARRLRVMLADLPVAQREVIALAYFGQLSHTEIAEQLSLPVGTVKGRMRLGLTKLRDQLAA
jgi:RNA polymerase sigma-70 factor (ECF subfamily)